MGNNPTDLKASGLKATLPRIKILEIFQNSEVRHLTAEDVYKILLVIANRMVPAASREPTQSCSRFP